MADIRSLSLTRPSALASAERIAPNLADAQIEFDPLWTSQIVPTAIRAHAARDGQFAGTGPVDYLEALTLYALIRHHKPTRILELGFANGISSWVLASALERNGQGVLDTVDIQDGGSIVPQFWAMVDRGLINVEFCDALDFLADLKHEYDFTFSDALHTLDFNIALAKLLRSALPRAIHCYHEWALSPKASRTDARYVSMKLNLGSCGEREAFEQAFSDRRHEGVPASCGLGVVFPNDGPGKEPSQ